MSQNENDSNPKIEKASLTRLGGKEWMKKLELATGKPVQLGGARYASKIGANDGSDQRSLQFRCAGTGKMFFALFARYSSSHKFQLVSISKTTDEASPNIEGPSLAKSRCTQKSFDASDFDWTGWFCPQCGHKETFFQCGSCREYICGNRVRRLQNGTETFACHDGCGETGEIKGYLKSLQGSHGQPIEANKPLLDTRSSRAGKLPQAQKRDCLPPPELRK